MLYETAADRLNEARIASRLGVHIGAEACITSTESPYDVEFWREGVRVAVAEVKRRYNAREKYPTLAVDRAKIATLMDEPTAAFLAVQWEDALGVVLVETMYDTAVLHRRDRGDPLDKDVVCLIPVRNFVLLA